MKKTTHIALGDSAAGCLKVFLRNIGKKPEEKVLGFRDDLSIGPVSELNTEKGLNRRCQWLLAMYNDIGCADYIGDFENDFSDLYKSVECLDKDQDVVIWHGQNTGDQMALRFLVSVLQVNRILEVDVSKGSNESKELNMRFIRSLGECCPEEIENLMPVSKLIETDQLEQLKREWLTFKHSNSVLRIIEAEELLEVDESYYDSDIVSNCSYSFDKAACVIGRTMGLSNQVVSDTYLDYRIRKLIRNNVIDVMGRQETMRTFSVKSKDSLGAVLTRYFDEKPPVDLDGFYHFLIEENALGLKVDVPAIENWSEIDLSNKLIIDYDLDSHFSLTWFKDSRVINNISSVQVDKVEVLNETYGNEQGDDVCSESLILYIKDIWPMLLIVQFKPYISIELKRFRP